MKKRIIISLLIIVIGLFLYFYLSTDKRNYYILKNDYIRNITSIVGKRKLYKKSRKKQGDTIIKEYKYKNIDNPTDDLSKYIKFIEEKSNFIPTKTFDLANKKGKIQIARYSTNKDYIIIMDISYNNNSYSIKITRGKGKITPLNNF